MNKLPPSDDVDKAKFDTYLKVYGDAGCRGNFYHLDEGTLCSVGYAVFKFNRDYEFTSFEAILAKRRTERHTMGHVVFHYTDRNGKLRFYVPAMFQTAAKAKAYADLMTLDTFIELTPEGFSRLSV